MIESPCCGKRLIEVPSEFVGDYTLRCPECGCYYEDTRWDGMTARDFMIAEARLQEMLERG